MSDPEIAKQAARLADDMLRGAAQIAAYTGLDESAVYYAHRKKKLPIAKWGRELVAFRSKIDRAMKALTP